MARDLVIMIANACLHILGIDRKEFFSSARLDQVLHLLDSVGLDMELPFDGYHQTMGGRGSGTNVRQSLIILINARIETEVRTTIWPSVIGGDRIRRLAGDLRSAGVENFVVQEARDMRTRFPVGEIFFLDTVYYKKT